MSATINDLTARQQAVLKFIEAYCARHGYAPTLREIAAEFKMRGTRGAERHLAALERKGVIERSRRAWRGIRLVGREVHRVRRVPILGRVAAGQPLLAEECLEGHLTLDTSTCPWPDAFLLRVHGDSMREAGIIAGDLCLVRPQPTAEDGEIVVALLNDEATVKYLRRTRGGLRLVPANPDYRPIRLQASNGEARLLGTVAAVLRFLEKR